eukprot:9503865-Pyramimonas_sp.AAC.1
MRKAREGEDEDEEDEGEEKEEDTEEDKDGNVGQVDGWTQEWQGLGRQRTQPSAAILAFRPL